MAGEAGGGVDAEAAVDREQADVEGDVVGGAGGQAVALIESFAVLCWPTAHPGLAVRLRKGLAPAGGNGTRRMGARLEIVSIPRDSSGEHAA